ncbi:Deoxyuridine 5'-triphosphate nucleotidohydrolase [ANME-1 cluster archaeon GoMg2]|nr:Deoxyuridine 5'-triphosphate nucleotidohydrolase [ANME-1 cluster archaeon GoMg2]
MSKTEKTVSELQGSVLSKSQIRTLLRNKPPLIEKMIDASMQLQQNGVDLTLKTVEKIAGAGCIDFSNKDRKLSDVVKLDFDDDWLFLAPGPYKIIFNEIVHLPKDIMAIGAPRTSLIRCGVTVETGIWDAGYEGRSESLLVVLNEAGIRIKKNARVLQLVFIKLSKKIAAGEAYGGIYQSENIGQSQMTLDV